MCCSRLAANTGDRPTDVEVLRSAVLAALLHGTRAVTVSQTLSRATTNGITELSFFLLLLLFSSPNLSGQRLDVYHAFTHGVALVRI